jgi:hypothetical protein
LRFISRLTYRHRDIERLLAGGRPQGARLSTLSPYTVLLRRAGDRVPSADQVNRFAALAANLATVDSRRPAYRSLDSTSHRSSAFRLRPRLAGALLALAVMLSASAGVAYAADSSAPGDTLYSLDCALEDFGIGDGGLSERLDESASLFQAGRFGEGLTSIATAIAESSHEESARKAAAALLTTAEAVSSKGDKQPGDVRAQVADALLTLVATDLADTKEFGEVISALAHSLTTGSSGNQDASPKVTTTSGADAASPSPSAGGSEGPRDSSSETPGNKGR